MDALHLGDKGYFLLSDAGFKYYIWRYAARLDNPTKSYYDNILGHIEPFHIDPNCNKPSTVIASTYHFFYDQWAKTTLKIEIQKLFCQVALKQGTSGSQKITRAWKKVNSYFAKAREIYLKTPGDPLEAVAFLTTAEEFWWDDAHDPLVTSPSRKVTHEDKGEEIFYLHEVDRAAVNKACHYGHLSRSIDIWSTPRTRTSLWAPNCKPRRGSIVQPEKISWTARLTPLAGLEKELKPPLIRESSPNFWEQAQEWVSTVDKQEDRALFESFDFEKAKADDLLNFKEETPPPSPVAAHGMDAEAIPNEEPRSKRVRDEEEQDKEVSRKRARVEEEVTQDTSSVRLETSPSEPISIQQQITPLNLDRSSETGYAKRMDSGYQVDETEEEVEVKDSSHEENMALAARGIDLDGYVPTTTRSTPSSHDSRQTGQRVLEQIMAEASV